MNEVIIDGCKYTKEEDGDDIRIVILQRGWVMVGIFSRDESDCQLKKSSNIRRWGTTRGLGEIALNGPTENTKLDPNFGLIEFDYLTVVATIRCNKKKWENVL
jgi:hypothetical protein